MILAPILPALTNAQEFTIYEPPQPTYTPGFELDTNLHGKITFYYEIYGDELYLEPQIEATFNKGILEGPIKIWTNNNHLYCSGEMSNNRKTGQWKFYHSNGTVKEEGIYDAKQDSSFLKTDKMIGLFLTPSYFEYGYDTASIQEMQSALFIPQLNVGLNRKEGRKGLWKKYDPQGNLLEERFID